ncbi:hypothetical protein [Siphonobacter sp. SORGH_AS_1065]|uniref:hypothetical protein n=1 Tax=Siphonobacter sp. SORGH_AS_1065 TaxID=3041795 RepID=UPI0027850A0B|nr:hypothetical protein [Siphonobacter sp. SORGH_AS_1065]MDQ1085956.1 hypothetical protein [Siphonobacter sp. SORGH_AS_1065]
MINYLLLIDKLTLLGKPNIRIFSLEAMKSRRYMGFSAAVLGKHQADLHLRISVLHHCPFS